MTIRSKFLYSILLIIAIPILIAPLIEIPYIYDLNINQTSTLIKQNVQQIASNMNHIIDDIISASNMVVLDNEILDILQNKENPQYSFSQSRLVNNKLNNIIAGKLYPYTVEITVFDNNGNIYSTDGNHNMVYDEIINQEWYEQTIENNSYFLWSAPADLYLEGKSNGIMMSRMIKRDLVEECGVLLIYIACDQRLDNILYVDEEFEGTVQYIINGQGEIIMEEGNDHKNHQFTSLLNNIEDSNNQATSIDKKEFLITTNRIDKVDWQVVQATPYDSILIIPQNYYRFKIILNAGFLLLIAIVAFFVSDHVTHSIRELCSKMELVMKGDFKVKSNIKGSTEIELLSDTFNMMTEEIDMLIVKVEQAVKEKEQMKLEALQAQINPHFLLNTLNGIKWLCIVEGAKTAEKMLVNLGYLLEYTLGKYEDIVTLEDELNFLQKYDEIQKMRYGKIYSIYYQIPESLCSIEMPILLLQPIVENSILHAFTDNEGEGKICISANENEGYIYISVRDNGVGMTEEEIDAALLIQSRKKKYSNIGLRNVQERIKLYYGDNCDLIINSKPGIGLNVTLKLTKEIKEPMNESTDR